ncbi:MAG: inorganic diphosphatase [Phycisphaerales bacterium]|nr:MAG: inorganic diphosphatase [Phycisphaerales bacterium]
MPWIERYAKISPGTDIPRVVNTIVEIPKGRRNKFELDKTTGLFKLDRYLFSASHYPGDYGFIPQTLAEDNDPLDVLVMVNEPTFTGCLIETRVVGLFLMTDRGANDFKVLGVPNTDPNFNELQDLDDVPSHFLREVEHFFATYKQLEDIETETHGWKHANDAVEEVRESVTRFKSYLQDRESSAATPQP